MLDAKAALLAACLAGSYPGLVYANCLGSASPDALGDFNKNPIAFMKAQGSATDLGAQMAALAAAAVNAHDPGFGPPLAMALGVASADQGKLIGTALGGLEKSCSDATDPADRADKTYISVSIAPNMLTNVAANTAYGEAIDGGQSASTGDSSGGGAAAGGSSGVGGQTGTLPAGSATGTSDAVSDVSSSTPTIAPSDPNVSVGSLSTSKSEASVSFETAPRRRVSPTLSTVLQGGGSVSAN